MEYRKLEAGEVLKMDEAELKAALKSNDTAVEELKQQVKTGEGKLEAANKEIGELKQNQKEKEKEPTPKEIMEDTFGYGSKNDK